MGNQSESGQMPDYGVSITHSHSEKQPEPCRDGDTLSILAGNDNPENFEDLAIEPPEQAIEPSEQAIKPPNSAVQLNTSDDICGDRIDSSKQQSVELSNASEGQPGLYDPEAVTTSWSPSQEFKDFLEKNFRRKLSFDHICDILEEQAIPQVDSLVTPTLDPPMLSHVSYQNKKFVQERDKELAVVQRAMLNITGPLFTLHDRLENNLPVSPTELKLLVEQSLCLVGSANSQLSVLRRKKVLASINKSKIDLANQPLPNAQRWLFGDDFPSIASKEAELSRGLAKNLAPTAPKIYNQDPKQPSRSFSQSTKYNTQNNRESETLIYVQGGVRPVNEGGNLQSPLCQVPKKDGVTYQTSQTGEVDGENIVGTSMKKVRGDSKNAESEFTIENP
ncbi:Hypothetical predicted protein [Paramuricea clavata]|uniref:Uncharacterized protein n=1 Tax=Paramuricea clavata TaxID=317549 RepID=A0A7D9DZ57_PARCT|nr:Hypothetical predicted protein [Paramuricea clavata]